MNSTALELALKKQRLLLASERLRADFGRDAAGLTPAFVAADFAMEGVRWVRRNPEVVVAATVVLLVIRPASVWRWTRRIFVGWQAWKRLRASLERHQLA